ncbi:hypothetical protein ACFQ1R_06765 [Mariniflexile jejuense]|uniref:Secretion system C-terminal sorting domain-containing protein n=1 Tax=Mariniflexile jejuense TaxID=1173582 RepID=A0ABW3JH21_9FLAO
MKKFMYLFFHFSLVVFALNAQEDCEKNLEKANSILLKKSPFGQQNTLFALVEPCALQGDAKAENYLGMFYLNGIQTKKDINKAFYYISSAAHKAYPEAQYNLGRLYKYGMGCELSFAKAMEWFEKATENGSQRAAYTLGYMYFKGYGVTQDYQKAVYWFNQSTDVMAVHFLGLCYYLGYGVPADENKALEFLLNNNTVNSKTLAKYIQAQQKEKNEVAIEATMQTNIEVDSTYIQPEVISEINIETYQETLTKEMVAGEWIGKLVQYDWSGKTIERIVPISINFDASGNTAIGIKASINGQEKTASAQWQDGNIYIDTNLSFAMDRLYPDNPNELSLDYTVFTLVLQQKELLGTTYLTGTVDTFIESWTEYGQPMSLVLRPKDSVDALDTEILEALAAQENQFIKLYPVPFNNSLTVQYQLETASEVFVELVGLHTAQHISILPNTTQQAGEYTYTIPIDSSLPEGYYVVRIIAGNQIYTRMIVKSN